MSERRARLQVGAQYKERRGACVTGGGLNCGAETSPWLYETSRSSLTTAVVTFRIDLCPSFSFPAFVSLHPLDKF